MTWFPVTTLVRVGGAWVSVLPQARVSGEWVHVAGTPATVQGAETAGWFISDNEVDAPAGDLENRLLVLMQVTTASIGGPPLGGGTTWNTLMHENLYDGGEVQWWWKIGGDSEPSSWELQSVDGSAVVVAIAGAKLAEPTADSDNVIASTTTVPTPSTTPLDPDTGTPVATLDLRWAATVGEDVNQPQLTPPDGWTLVAAEAGPETAVHVASRVVPAGATGAHDWTAGEATDSGAGGTTNFVPDSQGAVNVWIL